MGGGSRGRGKEDERGRERREWERERMREGVVFSLLCRSPVEVALYFGDVHSGIVAWLSLCGAGLLANRRRGRHYDHAWWYPLWEGPIQGEGWGVRVCREREG